MLFSIYINKVYEVTITKAENGLYYLEPTWQKIIEDNELSIDQISDIKTKFDLNDLYEVLKLQVKKLNTINSKKPAIIDWLYDTIMTQVEPTMLQTETDYMKQFMNLFDSEKSTDSSKEDWDKFTKG